MTLGNRPAGYRSDESLPPAEVERVISQILTLMDERRHLTTADVRIALNLSTGRGGGDPASVALTEARRRGLVKFEHDGPGGLVVWRRSRRGIRQATPEA